MAFSQFEIQTPKFKFIEQSLINTVKGRDNLLERGLLLYLFAKTSKAKVILETGTSNGFSSVCFAQAIKDNDFHDGVVHTIDYYVWGSDYSSKEQADKSIKMNGFQQIIKQHIGNSLEELPKILTSLNLKVDLAHIDSEHDYKTPKEEFILIEPYLNQGAYILFHDTDIKAVNNAVTDILSEREKQYEKIIVPLHSEMTILRKIM